MLCDSLLYNNMLSEKIYTTVKIQNFFREKITSRLHYTNACYHSVHNLGTLISFPKT
jgi:hypothetical protein